MKCKHKWIQVKDMDCYKDIKGERKLVGFVVFCEKCHEVNRLLFANCPVFEYPKEKK